MRRADDELLGTDPSIFKLNSLILAFHIESLSISTFSKCQSASEVPVRCKRYSGLMRLILLCKMQSKPGRIKGSTTADDVLDCAAGATLIEGAATGDHACFGLRTRLSTGTGEAHLAIHRGPTPLGPQTVWHREHLECKTVEWNFSKCRSYQQFVCALEKVENFRMERTHCEERQRQAR